MPACNRAPCLSLAVILPPCFLSPAQASRTSSSARAPASRSSCRVAASASPASCTAATAATAGHQKQGGDARAWGAVAQSGSIPLLGRASCISLQGAAADSLNCRSALRLPPPRPAEPSAAWRARCGCCSRWAWAWAAAGQEQTLRTTAPPAMRAWPPASTCEKTRALAQQTFKGSMPVAQSPCVQHCVSAQPVHLLHNRLLTCT